MPAAREHSGIAEIRRARRAYVRRAHPDRGGDPAAFTAGLRRLDQQLEAAIGGAQSNAPAGRNRVTVVAPANGLLGRLRAALAKRSARRARRDRLR